jgi:hypothetical protein
MPTDQAPHPSSVTPGAKPASVSPKRRSKRPAILTAVAIVFVYLASVVGYFWLDSTADAVEPRDLQNGKETVVLLELNAIRPVDNAVEAAVTVIPERTLTDQFGMLTDDLTVRLYPSNDFGELSYPRGHTPGRENVSMFAFGDADHWPFDTFTTGTISADVFAGSGAARRYVPARVEIAGSLNGWDVHAERHAAAGSAGHADDNATVTFKRSRGPLALIAGFCLVLLALPAIAFYVSIELLLGRKAFQPAFSTFLAAMLFSVVPIRNVLPGSPPAGSWIDEAVTVWVLIALTAATVVYVIAWARRAD